MSRLCFIDTETTSLRPDRRAWEVGLIVRDPGLPDTEFRWLVRAEDLDLGNADLMSLKIGRFYERHPGFAPGGASYDERSAIASEELVLEKVELWTRGAHLVGAVVNFDADALGTRMRAHGILPSWHYHLIEIEALAVGYLHGRRHGESADREWSNAVADAGMPWKSDELMAALGISVPEGDRHTALGDAKSVRDAYDAVTGRIP